MPLAFDNPDAPDSPDMVDQIVATITPGPDGDTQAFDWTKQEADEDSAAIYTNITLRVREFEAVYPALDLDAVDVSVTPDDTSPALSHNFHADLPLPLTGFSLGYAFGFLSGLRNGVAWETVVPIKVGDGTTTTDPDPGTGGGGDTGGGTGGETPTLMDVDISLGSPVTDISMGGSILYAPDEPDSFVHVLVKAVGSADGADVDYRTALPNLAVVRTPPEESDFVPADWLTRTSTTPAETYARIDVSGLDLTRGAAYYVYVQITVLGQTFTRRAPGLLIVR